MQVPSQPEARMARVVAFLLAAYGAAAIAQQGAIALPDLSPTRDATIVDVPQPKPGDWQSFQGKVGTVDCARWEVTDVNREGYLLSACDAYRARLEVASGYNLHEITTADGQPIARFDPYFPLVQFPLAVGGEWELPYRGHLMVEDLQWEGRLACRVTEFAPVTVRAGTFDAFRIECYDKRRAPMVETGANLTAWYAPAVQGVVKTVDHEDTRWNNELDAFGPR